MSASSINRKVAEVEKAKKVERRNARNKQEAPVVQAPKPVEVEVAEQPVIIDSGPVKAKPAASKGFFKKKSKKSN
tara:strand:- start:802 stop:1026 length:225 start_codon:yes stop_codon:yes gene_type:complete